MTYVAAFGTARIQHADTGEVFEIDADELDFEAIGADERNMGLEIHHQAELEHPELGTLTWGLWEYPVGIENMTETEIGPHTILEDIDYGLRHEPDEEEPTASPASCSSACCAVSPSITRSWGYWYASSPKSKVQARAMSTLARSASG